MLYIHEGLGNISASTYYILKRITPLYDSKGKFFICLCQDEDIYKQVYYNFSVFKNIKDVMNVDLYHLNPSSLEFTQSLFALYQKKQGIYLCLIKDWQLVRSLFKKFKKSCLKLTTKDLYTPQELKSWLLEMKYERSSEELAGTFKDRGGVYTIYTSKYREPIKIEFGFEGIESIKLGKERKESILIPPFDISLADVSFDNNNIELDEDFVYILLNYKLKSDWLKNFDQQTDLHLLNFLGQGNKFSDFYTNVLSYRKNFQKFNKDILKLQKDGYTIYISTFDKSLIKKIIVSEDIDFKKIKYLPYNHLLEPFYTKQDKIFFITQDYIWGKDYFKRERIENKHAIAFLNSLQKGDYLSHQDYGIGIYQGLTETNIDGYKRENVVIKYARGDILYLPVDLIYKIDKYVGVEKPKINRLSDFSWHLTKKKVTEDAQALASELIKIYAQREVCEAEPLPPHPEEEKIIDTFPYQETIDQKKAIQKILLWLQREKPMDALVIGDVGFGKTEVAIRAILRAVLNHKQVAFLCPTTILAQQHFDTISKRLSSFNIRVEVLSRFTKKLGGISRERKILTDLYSGDIDVLIGTHRILSKDVKFKNLALLVLDEEQKFGVRDKEKIKKIKNNVHVLTMTATPIPRTLYFSLSGLKDIVTIKTPPKNRKAIHNYIGEYKEDIIFEAIKEEKQRGGQVYYVYNNINKIFLEKQKLEKLLEDLDLVIKVLHARMKEEEIAEIMHAFDQGKIDVLVCTSIIENGLDLPNVNTLIITEVEKFGLAQLYQIRGRIGRSSRQAYAYFFYNPQKLTKLGIKRLKALEQFANLGDSYQIAAQDLEIRGIGDLLGKRQHGHIKSVGLNLYLSILNQEIYSFLSGEKQIFKKRPLSIELPYEYEIPSSVIKDDHKRLILYHQLSSIDSLSQLQSFYQKKLSKYKNQAIENLYRLLRIKLLGQEVGVKEINYIKSKDIREFGKEIDQIVITLYNNNKLNKNKIDKSKWKIKGLVLKARFQYLNNIFEEIEKILYN